MKQDRQRSRDRGRAKTSYFHHLTRKSREYFEVHGSNAQRILPQAKIGSLCFFAAGPHLKAPPPRRALSVKGSSREAKNSSSRCRKKTASTSVVAGVPTPTLPQPRRDPRKHAYVDRTKHFSQGQLSTFVISSQCFHCFLQCVSQPYRLHWRTTTNQSTPHALSMNLVQGAAHVTNYVKSLLDRQPL